MTNADKIRSMSDEALADFLTKLLSHHRAMTIKGLQEHGVALNVNVIEMPMLAKVEHLKWLREPVEIN